MKDEISFRSLIVKNTIDVPEENKEEKLQNNQFDNFQERDINFFLNKQKSSTSNLSSNMNNNSLLNTPNKEDSKNNIIREKIKEYFNKNKQLNKNNFDSFLSFIGLKDIWPSEEEQMFFMQTIESKAKNKDNIDYEAALSGVNEFLENKDDDDDEEIGDKKSACFEKISNSYLDISINENIIDEYLNSIKDNIELLFGIKFINELFLKNYINNTTHYSINTINTMHINNSIAGNGLNYDLDKNEPEGDTEVIQIDNNKNDKKVTIISLIEIINDIQTKYRFIKMNNEELNTYFNNLKKNNRKSASSNNIIFKNDKKQEYYLDKDLINYCSATIELKITTKIKNDEENNNNENEDNNINNDNNDNCEYINSDKKEENNINKKENDELSYEQILEKFENLDIMISDSYETINNYYSNKDLINLIKIFNKYYIMNKKKILYDKIKDLILEKKKYLEKNQKKEPKVKFNINEPNQNIRKSKKLIPDEENDFLKQQNEELKQRNEFLKRENLELRENLTKNINEIVSRNNNIKINKLNLPNNNFNSNINLLSARNARHIRNKTMGDQNKIINNLKNNQNNNNLIYHNHLTNETDLNNDINNNNNINNNLNNNSNLINNSNLNNNSNGKIMLQLTKTNTNSLYDFNIDEIVNSKSDIFSVIGNNGDKMLLETAQLGNEDNQHTPNITPRSNYLENKDENNNSSFNIAQLNDMIDSGNFGKMIKVENSKINNDKNGNKNNNIKKLSKKTLNDDNLNNNKISFSPKNNDEHNNGIINNKHEKKKHYDFIYLSSNSKVSKLLLHNNEKIKSNEIFSDNVYYIINGSKKKKGILLITSQCFYILDDTPQLNCEIRIIHQLLSSISISQENFNHLLISFTDDSYFIIEIYRRIYLLNYLKDLYINNNYKKINIFFCDSFNIKLGNNHSYLYELKNNKNIIVTPNFENAEKIGFLSVYKENFFSAYFSEKLVVLCSIGLIIFSKSNINIPKMIIPIIGASIKQTASNTNANTNEILNCFKIKTVNNEVFIIGSSKKKEINDWIQELKNYQKNYDIKMNEIMSYFEVHSNNNNIK